MALPLEGTRVVDWTIWQQGPVCSAILADLGAEVIKIEERVGGDPGRGILSMAGVQLTDRPNFYFEANNRNKKSITLDLKQPDAREIVYKLVEKSDVFVQNYRMGVPARLGLDYETLKQHNEKLIYASATGYGPEGPDAGEPSFDQLGLARSGIMMAAGEPEMDPLAIAGGVADQMGAIMLSHGVMAALLAREKHGIGQKVDGSHLGSMMMLQGLSISMKLMMGAPMGRSYRKAAGNPLWNHYRCSDGQWIMLGMLQPDRYWADFCAALGRPEMATDERFAGIAARSQNAAAAIEFIDEAFASASRDEWMKTLKESPGDFIYTLVNSVADLPEDPQVKANDYIIDFEHPQFGTTQVLGMPYRLSETPGSVREPAPEFGQHTEEVLVDLLGYDWDQVTDLRKREVI
jgi:crotonobetainyl-CoA:carnitine CoA-transferase CaiB-like acyl-CoA transferase